MLNNREYPACFIQNFQSFAAECKKEGVYGDLFSVEMTLPQMEVRLKGVQGSVASFMSLEYLNVAHLPEIIEAGVESLRCHGSGFASSRTTIDSVFHQGFEAQLADFKRAQSCILTNRGYDASYMLVSLLAGPMQALRKRFSNKRKAVVFMDELSHASLQDAFISLKGSRETAVKLKNKKYRHLDYAHLCDLLAGTLDEDVDRFIVSDSLFSIHGDFADVRRLLSIAKEYEAFLLLDGAHSDGVYGKEGRGVVEAAGISGEDLSYIYQSGTLSKAFGGMGGYMTAFPELVELARNSQWNYIFSAGIPTFQAAMYQKTLEVIRGEVGEARRKRLGQSSEALRDTLRTHDFNIFQSASHVIPVLIGEDAKCLEVQQYLVREHSSLCAAIRFPAVQEKEAVIRVALSAGHSDSQIERLVHGLLQARDKYKF